ncbi:hypothetical protein [Paracoccus ravus]|uniref:hypothetical protein n=1 Tax=Paracoccus ravus TaxID=2447760 RepID=UPI00106ED0F1|nr:hypothetical protein [Paracoccus ravus]
MPLTPEAKISAQVDMVLHEARLANQRQRKQDRAEAIARETPDERVRRLWAEAHAGLDKATHALHRLNIERQKWDARPREVIYGVEIRNPPFPIDPKFTAQMRGISTRAELAIRELGMDQQAIEPE